MSLIGELTDEELLSLAGKDPSDSLRVDGTQKGTGFFGVQKMTDGSDRDMTEFSVGVDFGQGETEIPTLVPTLTGQELEFLKSGNDPSQAIMDKATAHAEQRIAAGKSPFIEEGEDLAQIPVPATDEEILRRGGQIDWPSSPAALALAKPPTAKPPTATPPTATPPTAQGDGPRDISSLSDVELKAMGQVNQPGAYTGFSDALKESVASLVGFPGTVIETVHGFVVDQLGLPEYEDAMLSGKGLKRLMADIGLTSGLEYEERTDAGKIGAVGGEIVGMSIPISAGVSLASKGVNLAKTLLAGYNPTIVQKILTSAAKYPKAFVATEVGAITGAASGGMIAEASFPGNETARIVGEVVGTLVNPGGTVAKVTGRTGEAVADAALYFSRSRKEDNAGEILRTVLEETGEDIPAVIKLLEKVEDVNVTSAVKTGSPGLLAVESKVIESSPTFANKVKDISKSVFADMRQVIDNMTATGDPQLLRVAAKLRGQYFDDLINERVRLAKKKAAEAAANITVKGAKSGASVNVYEIMKKALTDLRTAETSLWSKIPKDIAMTPTRLAGAKNKITEELLQEESVPFAATLDRMLKDGTTSGEMLVLRNRALEKARTLRAEKKYDEARRMGIIADAALEDLGGLGLPIVDKARDFSLRLNDNFTRTFAGDVLSTSKTGAERIPPELILERAFGSGGTAGKVRMNDLVDAGKYADDALLTAVIGDSVRNEQERFLRMVADNTMTDGIVDANKLQAFMSKNTELLERFPQLVDDLSNAGSATRLLTKTENMKGQANKAIMRKAAFAQVAEVENPTAVVNQVLSGKNPIGDYKKLAKLAKRSGPGATAGLRTSTIDHEITQSMVGPKSTLSFVALKENLAPRMDMMVKEGIADQAFARNMNKMLDRAAEIETNITTRLKAGEVMGDPDQFFDLMVRIVGANVGGASAMASSSGAGLVIAGATVRTFRNLLEKIPASRVMDVITEAAENPAFMAQLLKKAKTPAQARGVVTQLRSPLIAAGIISVDED